MARYTKTDVVTGDVVKSDVNVQLGLIETAIADSLSRKGDLPNTMEADIDMNSNQILNLPDATTSQEPATYGQLLSVPAVQQGKSYVQEDVPVNPTTEGVRWYKPSEARTYVWYIDSDGGQWVEENPSVADAPDRVRPYDTVALWQASPNAAVGDVVQLKDRANGIFDVISGTGTANTYNIIAHTSLSLSLSERPPVETTEARTWYVDPVLGTDAFGYGVSTGAGAFKTIQYAYDQIPNIINIEHIQTIQLADGTYNENYRAAATIPRPSIFYAEGKTMRDRTDKVAGRIVAGVRIVGNTSDKTLCIIKGATDYNKAVIYNLRGQIGFDSVTIQGLSGYHIDEMVMSHRQQSYIHLVDCIIDGVAVGDTNTGLVTESGGRIEFVGFGEIKNCREGASTLSNGDEIAISSDVNVYDCTNGLFAAGGGRIQFIISGSGMRVYNCTTALNGQPGGIFELRGLNTSTRVSIESPVTMNGSIMEATYVDFESTIQLEQSTLLFNTSGHQEALTALAGSNVRYRTSDTYTTGNTENNSSDPIRCYLGASVQLSGTNNLVKAGGTAYTIGDRLQDVSANSSTITIQPWDRNLIIRGSGANYTGNVLSAPTEQNQEVTIYADSFNVDLIASTTAYFGTGAGIAMGNSAGADYHAVTLKASSVSGTLLWRESGRSSLNN